MLDPNAGLFYLTQLLLKMTGLEMGWKLEITPRITRGNSNNQKVNTY